MSCLTFRRRTAAPPVFALERAIAAWAHQAYALRTRCSARRQLSATVTSCVALKGDRWRTRTVTVTSKVTGPGPPWGATEKE